MATFLDDIEIPIIEISEGWPVTDVKTLDDCEDAFAYLSSAVAGIEMQIELESFKIPSQQDGEWTAKAKAALRFKKAALAIVSQKRSTINKQLEREWNESRDRKLLRFIRDLTPSGQWAQWVTAFETGLDDRLEAAE